MSSVLRLRSVGNDSLGGPATSGIVMRLGGGASGASGPNLISDDTALGTLTADASALFVLASNAAGAFARKLTLGAVGRSLLGAATAADGRTLLGLATVAATGSYSDLTDTPTPYTLPIATAGTLGGIRVGSGLSIDAGTGVLTASGTTTTDASLLTSGTLADARLSSNVPLKNAANTFTDLQTIQPSVVGTTALRLRPAATDTAARTLIHLQDAYGGDGLSIQVLDNYAVNLNYHGNDCNFNSASNGQTVLNGTTLVDEFRRNGESGAGRLKFNFSGSGVKLFRFYTGGSVSGSLVSADNTGSNIPFLAVSPAAYTGPALRCSLLSSTATEREAVDLTAVWATSTDASRASRVTLSAYSTSTAQEGLRVEGNSGGVRLGLYGVTAVDRQTVTGSRGGNAALASLLTALAALGAITDSTTA